MSRGSGNEWSRLGQDNITPVHFSRPSSLRSSGYGNLIPQPGSGPTDRRYNFPLSSFRQNSDARFGATTGTRQFDESAIVRRNPRGGLGLPRETGPTMASFPRDFPPRLPWHPDNVHNIQDREDATKLEQQKTLKKLKKKIYGSEPKNLARRLSLYYNNSTGNRGNYRETNEDSKRCAICLDDFEPGTEVMVTPCNHMFHEDCIVPWMKSNGQCPVCRYVISEQIKANATASSSTNATPTLLVDDDPFLSDHVLSIIIAMDEAFSWGRLH